MIFFFQYVNDWAASGPYLSHRLYIDNRMIHPKNCFGKVNHRRANRSRKPLKY